MGPIKSARSRPNRHTRAMSSTAFQSFSGVFSAGQFKHSVPTTEEEGDKGEVAASVPAPAPVQVPVHTPPPPPPRAVVTGVNVAITEEDMVGVRALIDRPHNAPVDMATLLHTPDGALRPCARGKRCRARVRMPTRSIVMREWLSPDQWTAYKESGGLPTLSRPCLVCGDDYPRALMGAAVSQMLKRNASVE